MAADLIGFDPNPPSISHIQNPNSHPNLSSTPTSSNQIPNILDNNFISRDENPVFSSFNSNNNCNINNNTNNISQNNNNDSTPSFSSSFWSNSPQKPPASGFETLHTNFKQHGPVAKELSDFLQKSADHEKSFGNNLLKLSSGLTRLCCREDENNQFVYPTGHGNSASPLFNPIKSLTDKLSRCHIDMSMRLTDLTKEIKRYQNDEIVKNSKSVQKQIWTPGQAKLKKFQKAHDDVLSVRRKSRKHLQKSGKSEKSENEASVSETESNTLGSTMNNTISSINLEVPDKFNKDANRVFNEFNTESSKFQAHYESTLAEVEVQERAHLKHVRDFLEKYVNLVENHNVRVKSTYEQFQTELKVRDEEYLLRKFTTVRQTGGCKPKKMVDVSEVMAFGTGTGGVSSERPSKTSSSEAQSRGINSNKIQNPTKTPDLKPSPKSSRKNQSPIKNLQNPLKPSKSTTNPNSSIQQKQESSPEFNRNTQNATKTTPNQTKPTLLTPVNVTTSNRPAGTSTPVDPTLAEPIDQDDIEIQAHFQNSEKPVETAENPTKTNESSSTTKPTENPIKMQKPAPNDFRAHDFGAHDTQNGFSKKPHHDSDSTSDSDSDSDFGKEEITYKPKIVIREKPVENKTATADEIANIMQGFTLGLPGSGMGFKPPRPVCSRKTNDSSTSTESSVSRKQSVKAESIKAESVKSSVGDQKAPNAQNFDQKSIESETLSQKTEKPTQPHQLKVQKQHKGLNSQTVSQSTLSTNGPPHPMRAASVPPRMAPNPVLAPRQHSPVQPSVTSQNSSFSQKSAILQPVQSKSHPNSRLPSQEDKVVPLAKGEGSMVSLEAQNLANRAISPAFSTFSNSNSRAMATPSPLVGPAMLQLPQNQAQANRVSPNTAHNLPLAVEIRELLNAQIKPVQNGAPQVICSLIGEINVSIATPTCKQLISEDFARKRAVGSQEGFVVSLKNAKIDRLQLDSGLCKDLGTNDGFMVTERKILVNLVNLAGKMKSQMLKQPGKNFYMFSLGKYTVKIGASDLPINITSTWDISPSTTDISVTYHSALPISPLSLQIPVSGKFSNYKLEPSNSGKFENSRLSFNNLSSSQQVQRLHAKFLHEGSSPSQGSRARELAAQFVLNNFLCSGLDLELQGEDQSSVMAGEQWNYRFSIDYLRKRTQSSRYFVYPTSDVLI
jgi:hypothetical protein